MPPTNVAELRAKIDDLEAHRDRLSRKCGLEAFVDAADEWLESLRAELQNTEATNPIGP